MPLRIARSACVLLLLGICISVISGCGTNPAPIAQAPVQTTLTPRPTRARPTARPSATRPSTTNTPATSPTPAALKTLQQALGRTLNLTAYQMVFTWNVTRTLEAGQPSQDIHVDYRGAINRANSDLQTTTNGKSSETIVKDGATYVHGPLPLAGMDQAVWYKLPSGPGVPSLTFSLRDVMVGMTKRVNMADFARTGDTTVNGQHCDLYQGDLRPALSIFDGLGNPTTSEAQAREATPVVERMESQGYHFDSTSEAALLVCDDGFIHQLRSSVSGTAPDAGGKPISMTIMFDISNPNGDIAISAPNGAVAVDLHITGRVATVFNGGNVRAAPNTTGNVLDQINASETVSLLGKTSNGGWYKITNMRNVTGWVSATLLTVDPATAAQVPVTQ